METKELISYAKECGFSINEEEDKFVYQFHKKPNLIFEFIIVKAEFSIKIGSVLMWDVKVKDTKNKKEYNLYTEEYGEMDSHSKFNVMRDSYKDFIDLVTKNDIRLYQHHLFKLFGKKFFERTDVQYKSNKNWEKLLL